MDFPEERTSKRRKLDRLSVPPPDIRSVEDLQNLLSFRKTSSPEVKKGIQAFKDFLGAIPKTENLADQGAKLRLLKQYCDAQSPAEEQGVAFSDIISSWAYAGETNNDPVLSAVPAVLAQFLRIVSSYLEFRDVGLALCRSLLQKDQARLFDRGLSTSKSKEHLISPCIRLLTEIVTFDGGRFAGQLYLRKDALFKRIDLFLEQTATREDIADRRKPSLRRITQRYVIANLKLQSSSIKGDLIGQGKILHALLKGIERDGDDIIVEILQVLQNSILNDTSLHRKSRLLSTGNLISLLALFDYEEAPPADGDEQNEQYFTGKQRQKVRGQLHAFLLAACQLDKGLLLPQTGWYPQGMDPEFPDQLFAGSACIDLGLDSPLYFDEYRDKIPVKNGTLSTLIQNLKPESDDLQAALLLKIFDIAPELVADYFSKTKRFNSKPKDDSEWRAQSAFLFSVVRLPVPRNCGWHDKLPELPPPISIVIESILPRPLDGGYVTRCLNLNQEIITLFAAKLVTESLQKLASTLMTFKSTSTNRSLWAEASQKLMKSFIVRGPSVKDVIASFQRAAKGDEGLRAALIECLATFLTVLPQSAVAEKFDVAVVIVDVLQKLGSSDTSEDDRSMLFDQLSGLVIISERLPNIRWWHKAESSSSSPFVSLLKASVALDVHIPARRPALTLLRTVMTEKGIIDSDDKSFDALVTSLLSSQKWTTDQAVFSFIDNCMSRVVKQPIKYLEQLEAAQAYNSDKGRLSLLACCIAEQWPFVAKGGDKDVQKAIAAWVARFFNALTVAGKNFRVIAQLQDEMLQSSPATAKEVLRKGFEKQEKKPVTLTIALPKLEPSSKEEERPAAPESKKASSPTNLALIFGHPPSPTTSLSGLDQWPPASLETDLQSPRLARLLTCTTSPSEEIRRQTYAILQSLLPSLSSSSYPEAQRLHLLLGEVLETIKQHTLSHPLPTIVASTATLLLRILLDPSDKMYAKANRFLLRAPRWDPPKLPAYWTTQILLREPEHDDGHGLELDRLLQMLSDGLACPADMELYRRCGVFERVLALWSSAHIGEGARRRILMLVGRALLVGGGMTLVTRVGIGAWVAAASVKPRSEDERSMLDALAVEIAMLLEGEEGTRWRREGVSKKGRYKEKEVKMQDVTS